MATPWADYVVSLGKPRRWYRLAGNTFPLADTGFRADVADAINISGVSGTAPTYLQPGPLQLDTSSYSILFANAHLVRNSFDPTKDWNSSSSGGISFWFKTTSSGTQFMYGTHPTGTPSGQFAFYLIAGQLRLSAIDGANSTEWQTSATYNDGAWHFLHAQWWGSGNTQIYIDGALQSITPSPTTLGTGIWMQALTSAPANWTWAAGRDHRIANPLVGNLAEIMHWDRALTGTEILKLYAKAFPVPVVEGGIRRGTKRRFTFQN